MKQCRNCGKRIPDTLTFCSKECAHEMEGKFKKAFPISAKLLETEKVKEKQFNTGAKDLMLIYDYLDLNEAKDGRLIIKADIMKKIIYLARLWKTGKKREWVDKLSILTCVSTRKIREDYVQPLITIGVLAEFSDIIKFVGLPKEEVFW
jgi:hypothetical protein